VLVLVTPASLKTQFAAFLVFRFFDMVKPPRSPGSTAASRAVSA
jgi:hypothetical protein